MNDVEFFSIFLAAPIPKNAAESSKPCRGMLEMLELRTSGGPGHD